MSRFISVKGEKGIYKRKIEQIKLTNPLKMLSPLSRYDLIFYSPDRLKDIPVYMDTYSCHSTLEKW